MFREHYGEFEKTNGWRDIADTVCKILNSVEKMQH